MGVEYHSVIIESSLMEQISSNRTIAKNTFFLYGRMLFNLVVSLYTSRVILQVLGVSDLGVYQVVAGIVALFTFVNGSLAGATSRFLAFELGKNDNQRLSKTFAATLNVHIITAGILFFVCETVGLWFVNYKLNIPEGREFAANFVYQCSVMMTMLSLIQAPYNAAIIAHERMRMFAYVGILDTILKLVACYVLYITPFDRLVVYGLVLLLFTLIINLIYYIYCKHSFSECHFRWSNDWSISKPILVFSGWQLFGDFSLITKNQGLNILLNLFYGVTLNAACGFANTVYGAIVGFTNNFMMSVRPSIIKAYSTENYMRMIELIHVSCKYSFFLMMLLSAPFLFDSQYILELWLKTPPAYTAEFCKLSLLNLLVVVLTSPVTYAVIATGNNKILSLLGGTSMLLVLPFAYLFLKLGYNPTIPFIITPILQSLVSNLYVILLKKYIPQFSITNYYRRIIIPCVVIFILVVTFTKIIFSYVSIENHLLNLMAICSCTTILIFSFILLIAMSKEERKWILTRFVKYKTKLYNSVNEKK